MTFFIILITAVVSIVAFSRRELIHRYSFVPYQIVHRKQWYRIFTHALLHGSWEHLIINMFVLFSFGTALWRYFYIYMGQDMFWLFLGIYAGGIVVSSIPTLIKEKNNYNYSALGASGAVSAVVFACIFFDPLNKIYFFGVLPIPGILFGVIYLGYTYYMGKKNTDNIGHDAHFWGAIYGFVYPMLFKPSLISSFFDKLLP